VLPRADSLRGEASCVSFSELLLLRLPAGATCAIRTRDLQLGCSLDVELVALGVEHGDAVLTMPRVRSHEGGTGCGQRLTASSTRARRSDGGVPGGPPAFTSR
jgi:hypothetical protein